MKILLISGDDYAANTFENEMGVEEAKKLIEQGEKVESDEFSGEVFEFGEVDEKFIDFIRNEIQDYDMSKHQNFYIIK